MTETEVSTHNPANADYTQNCSAQIQNQGDFA